MAAGYLTVLSVKVMPGYSEANLPRVALAPAWLFVLGATTITPPGAATNPLVELAVVAGSTGSVFPQMSMASPACQV